jgi:hypothetical protein
MKRALFVANAILAFLLEIAALVALAFWGARTGTGTAAKTGLAIAAPLLAAVLWGLFAAPRARFAIPLAGQLAVKALVFGAATLALLTTGHPVLGSAFGTLVLLNTVAGTIWQVQGHTFDQPWSAGDQAALRSGASGEQDVPQ